MDSDSGTAAQKMAQADSELEPAHQPKPQSGRMSPEDKVVVADSTDTSNRGEGDSETEPEAEALMSQQLGIVPSQAATELGIAPPQQPKRSNMDRLRGFHNAAKQGLTSCTKVAWRIIRIGISLWQIADMVSDGFQTAKFYHLSSVSHEIMKG